MDHTADDVVGAQRAVGAEDVLVLLDGPAAQRDRENARAVAETQQRVHVARGARIDADDLDGRVAVAGGPAQVFGERVHGVRQDVLACSTRVIVRRTMRNEKKLSTCTTLPISGSFSCAIRIGRLEEILVAGDDLEAALRSQRHDRVAASARVGVNGFSR